MTSSQLKDDPNVLSLSGEGEGEEGYLMLTPDSRMLFGSLKSSEGMVVGAGLGLGGLKEEALERFLFLCFSLFILSFLCLFLSFFFFFFELFSSSYSSYYFQHNFPCGSLSIPSWPPSPNQLWPFFGSL